MADKHYRLSFIMSDGSSKEVEFTAPQGEKGPQGQTGASGKAAYQYALDGGFDGTEEEFSKLLAAVPTAQTMTIVAEDGDGNTNTCIVYGFAEPGTST